MAEKKMGQQMRFSDGELAQIRSAFQGNEELLKVLRKVFLPEIDPTAPLGQIVDLWMTLKIEDKDPEEVKIILLARNQLISHVEQQLMQLNILANMDVKSPEEIMESLKKDATQ